MKIKRILTFALMVFLFFILQFTLINYLKFGNIAPNICLVLIISIAYCNGPKYGAVYGFLIGLLCDVYFGVLFGFYSLLYVLIGYLTGIIGTLFYDYNFQLKMPVLLIGVSELVYNLLIYTFFFLLKGDLNIKVYLEKLIIPELIYTIIVGVVIFRIFYSIDQKLSLDERKADGYFVS